MTEAHTTQALSDAEKVCAFANLLNQLADTLHNTLRRLSGTEPNDTTMLYALLTEEYALRARSNILKTDANRRTIDFVSFSQSALLERLTSIDRQLLSASSLEEVQPTLSDLITFACAISPGKAKVVNFLACELGVQD